MNQNAEEKGDYCQSRITKVNYTNLTLLDEGGNIDVVKRLLAAPTTGKSFHYNTNDTLGLPMGHLTLEDQR